MADEREGGDKAKKGFAGLSSMVSDVEETVRTAEKQQQKAASSYPGTAPHTATPTNPTSPGTSGKTVIWWLVVFPALIFGAIALLSNNSPTTSVNQQDVQQPSAPPVPSTPPPQPAYIATVLANIRISASPRAAVVSQLPQWTEVSVSGVEGAWSHVSFTSPTGSGDGYILTRLIQAGTAQDARVAFCEVASTIRPSSGEVLLQTGTGSHSIKINAGASDALIKLRQNGKTELAFFVRANETGTVANLADGTYQIMFATGEGFSRKCLEFVNSMHVSSDPTPATFQTWQEPTEGGVIVHSSSSEYTLTQQVGGNFKPQDLDPGAFRE